MQAKYAEKNKWGKTPLNLCEESLEKFEPKGKKANQKPPPKGSLHDRLIQTRKTLMAAMGVPEEEQAKSEAKAKSPTKKPDHSPQKKTTTLNQDKYAQKRTPSFNQDQFA